MREGSGEIEGFCCQAALMESPMDDFFWRILKYIRGRLQVSGLILSELRRINELLYPLNNISCTDCLFKQHFLILCPFFFNIFWQSRRHCTVYYFISWRLDIKRIYHSKKYCVNIWHPLLQSSFLRNELAVIDYEYLLP